MTGDNEAKEYGPNLLFLSLSLRVLRSMPIPTPRPHAHVTHTRERRWRRFLSSTPAVLTRPTLHHRRPSDQR